MGKTIKSILTFVAGVVVGAIAMIVLAWCVAEYALGEILDGIF